MTNKEVAERFARCSAGAAGHFRTDGIKVWSYNMLIAERFAGAVCGVWILDRKDSPSVTTTRHRNLVALACERAGIKRV